MTAKDVLQKGSRETTVFLTVAYTLFEQHKKLLPIFSSQWSQWCLNEVKCHSKTLFEPHHNCCSNITYRH